MTLRVKVLGFEVVTVEFDIPEGEPGKVTAFDRGIKWMSGKWVGRMNR